MVQGLFLAVEGIDGSGKSGIVGQLAAHLRRQGREVVTTREPGGTHEGEALRALLLSGADDAWDPMAELLLMTAARVQHVRRVIAPALARGAAVVSDRFVGSTLAYQGTGRGLSEPFIRQLHAQAVGDLWPDLTLILDLDAATGLARSRRRLGDAALDEGRFESLDLAFHERIRAAFLAQAARDPARHTVIDASGRPDQVCALALAALDRLTG
ncbi:thymidylate kinase [Cereibacter ovatus]|uniref:Thymidylate kinase n=1 Tax=Cereibacter ovatus TaxID=439529 RepID=A0A285CNS6_9RHOB|nr:dTMP kinase [Cereibacter ovatus]SNX69214.1 thymidylate kinase [Cereibacter ovatus]